ncbi:hypothetical protein N9386_01925 [Gammaproteobacteria bacterium]|nr:hypothetical protein [Gammaproteobacteria bacterium]
MKITIDNWISLLIGIAVVAGAYYYLTNATAEREQKFEAMSECMNKTEYAEGNFDQCADEIGYN